MGFGDSLRCPPRWNYDRVGAHLKHETGFDSLRKPAEIERVKPLMSTPDDGGRDPRRDESQTPRRQRDSSDGAERGQAAPQGFNRTQNTAMRYATIGFELAASIGGMTLLGWWADSQLGTKPRCLIAGAVLGIVGGFYNFIRAALALNRETYGSGPRKKSAGRRDDETP